MKRVNNSNLEERQLECMRLLVRDILSDKTVECITFENVHGSIAVRRSAPVWGSVHVVGFTADNNEDYEEEEFEEENEEI